MKTKLTLLALATCCTLSFVSCNNDDNYSPDQAVTTAFKNKYPEAKQVEWETKSGFQVVDFRNGSYETEAWFDNKGNWFMTETDIPFKDLPAAIQTSFSQSAYGSWKVDDVDKLERADFATTYMIEVEQNEKEVDLQFAEDGTLIKITEDNDGGNYVPEQIPQSIASTINKMYPNASILEYDNENQGIEVDILHNGIHKEVVFDTNSNWKYTEWDIHATEVPEIVMNAFKASEYKNDKIDDIDVIEKTEGIFYVFEIERGNTDLHITIHATGIIVN